MKKYDIALVLQGGGKGERFVPIDIPKPIFPLSWDQETCLKNILKDVKGYHPTFLHIRADQKEKYDKYLEEKNILSCSYIFQEETVVYGGRKGEAIVEKGKLLTTSKGPGSFRNGLKEAIKGKDLNTTHFAVYDGCKTGICWDDVQSGVERLVEEDKGVLCYVRSLDDKYYEEEKDTARYDFVVNKYKSDQKVISDKRGTPYSTKIDRESKVLTGLTIFNYQKFLEKTKGLEGWFTGYEDLKYIAHYYQLRTTDLINSFGESEDVIEPFDNSDIIFADMPEEHYYPSIKKPSDFEKYWEFKEKKTKNNRHFSAEEQSK